MAQIDAFFKLMNDEGASDLHMVSGQQPVLRIRGDMERVKFKVMKQDDLKAMLYEICPETKIKVFEETGDFVPGAVSFWRVGGHIFSPLSVGPTGRPAVRVWLHCPGLWHPGHRHMPYHNALWLKGDRRQLPFRKSKRPG